MSIFNFFRRQSEDELNNSNKPKIEFGFRGEDITYRLQGREIYISFTWCNGHRVYPDSIDRWNDGIALTNKEKERIFNDVLHYIKRTRKSLIVVINTDDPSKDIWEHICSINQSIIDEIEYTSNAESHQFEKNMYLDFLKAGNQVFIKETEVKNEKELEEALRKYKAH